METPLAEELMRALQHSRAQVFSHDIVMDAIDISLALDRHALIYGVEGLFLLETETASWRLPPSRVAWVPAGTHVKATTIKAVRCTSLFFHRDFASAVPLQFRVFPASAVVREMIKYARRWSVDVTDPDAEADRFFLTLLDLCRVQMQEGEYLSLPKARSADLEQVLDYTQAHLAEPIKLEDAARKAAMSPRTLMRRLNTEIHMTWGQYLLQARMVRAMEHLARGKQVTETALDVGYNSIPAFSTAFRKFTDMTPTEYQSKF